MIRRTAPIRTLPLIRTSGPGVESVPEFEEAMLIEPSFGEATSEDESKAEKGPESERQKKLKKLKKLYIWETKISEGGIKTIKTAVKSAMQTDRWI